MRTALVATFVLGMAGPLSNAAAQTTQTCITPKCHATLGKERFVHGPVAVGECAACHALLKGETHKFSPVGKTESLCLKCHEPMVKKAVIHAPVAQGQCTACHDPHQAKQKFLLRGATVAGMCYSCHKREMFTKKYVHHPVAEGDCIVCHAPHTSDKGKLLVEAGSALCFQCHADLKDSFARAKHIHKPVADNCLSCHSAHSNDAQFILTREMPGLCLDCHSELREHLAAVVIRHNAVDNERKCMNCHTPHDAPYAAQLKNEPMALCLSCHNTEMTTAHSEKLGNMAQVFDTHKEWHGPVRDRDCSGCHDTHGSAFFRILRQRYPKEFYVSYSADQYDLCFSCHDPTLAQDATTTTLTGFRDGDNNLHYVHVNRKVKGRTCRSCHETHASQKPRHIRESVPFGQWMLPIRFESSANGGKCSPGCHAPLSYSRSTNAAPRK